MAIPRLLTNFLSQSTDPINIKVPWQISDQDGMWMMNYSKEDAVRDNVLVWAKTNWGERPYRFRFGLDARRYLFEPREIAKAKILDNARDQLPKYFPFLTVQELNVLTTDDDPNIQENAVIFYLKAEFDGNKRIIINETITQ